MNGAPKGEVQLRITGPGVTAEHAREVGESMVALLNGVTRGLGVPEGATIWYLGDLQWMCDGCELTVTAEALPAAWVNRDGLDYCEACQ